LPAPHHPGGGAQVFDPGVGARSDEGAVDADLLDSRARLEVRYLGKVATFGLMLAIGCIAWGNLGYAFERAFLACGWVFYAVAIVEYYWATFLYVGDLRDALAGER